ncbi:hypothetical protein L1887_59149 [Cichorium endivia]|nr:hypothetical protein L1887_59149 [Cichorium endivia]
MMKKLRPGEDWQVVASGGHNPRPAGQRSGRQHDHHRSTLKTTRRCTRSWIRAPGPSKRSRPQRNRPVKFTSQPTLIVKVKASAGTSSRYWRSNPTNASPSMEITLKRVAEALANPRQIDLNRVASQECRACFGSLGGLPGDPRVCGA